MEHDVPFGNSNRENETTFLDFPLFLGIFQWDEPTKRVPFTAEPEIPEILTKWKAPDVSMTPCHHYQMQWKLAWIGDMYTEKRKCQEYVQLNWGAKMKQTNN